MINYTKYTHLIINLLSMNIYQEFPFELLYVENRISMEMNYSLTYFGFLMELQI